MKLVKVFAALVVIALLWEFRWLLLFALVVLPVGAVVLFRRRRARVAQ